MRAVPFAAATFTLFPSMGEYPAYDDHVYDAFDAADDRRRAYRAAIRSAAPGRVVLDIGTGRDALWALEAARSGAAHVYAIEADPTAAAAATATIAAVGLADRVTLLPGHSTDQTLPVRAEACVSEIVGNIASAEGAIPVLADARQRLTTPDCTWIPFRTQTWAAAVDLSARGDLALAASGDDLALAASDGDLALAAESLPYLHSVFAAAGGPFDLRLCLAGPAATAIVSTAAPVESDIFHPDHRFPELAAHATAELRMLTPARPTGLLLWTRVACSASGGREVDALTGNSRSWAPVYVPLRQPTGPTIRVAFTRTTSDDNIHPDYEVTVDDQPPWHSPHHGGPFRATPFYRDLFTPDPPTA